MKIKLYNKIAACGLERLPGNAIVAEDLKDEDGIVVRSADLHEVAFPESLKAIARAGAGVNNIPLDGCTEKGIVVFNTPGANARAVVELALAALLLTSRKVGDGIEWAKTLSGNPDALKLVEKEKSRFVGPEIYGKTLGVIGLGAIGGALANAASALGMRVLGYDPYVSIDAAWALSSEVERVEELDRIFAESDYITVHVPSLPSTRGILGKDNIAKMRDGVRLLNLARADLGVDEDILAALESGKVAAYFTDFPTGALAGKPGVIATPHLGASTPEAEDNCAMMACDQLRDYLVSGNIKNSVNMPAVRLAKAKANRVGIFYRNDAETDGAVMALLAGASLAKGTRGGIAYVLAESDTAFDLEKINAVGGVVRLLSY
ncbi:MAG: 3-phosphoglycerate dehydrogenase [Clostridia bacterium]|nr:3-phosphoglycerate dehydrogenase [Clostridia bacterium]